MYVKMKKSQRKALALSMAIATAIGSLGATSPVPESQAATVKYIKGGKTVTFSDTKGIKTFTVNGKKKKIKAGSKKVKYTFGKNEGKYVIKYVTKKKKTITRTYIVDKTSPVISGVSDGDTYNKEVTITVRDNKKLKSLKVNNKAVKSPYTVSQEGLYDVVATDYAGNKKQVVFSIENLVNATPEATTGAAVSSGSVKSEANNTTSTPAVSSTPSASNIPETVSPTATVAAESTLAPETVSPVSTTTASPVIPEKTMPTATETPDSTVVPETTSPIIPTATTEVENTVTPAAVSPEATVLPTEVPTETPEITPAPEVTKSPTIEETDITSPIIFCSMGYAQSNGQYGDTRVYTPFVSTMAGCPTDSNGIPNTITLTSTSSVASTIKIQVSDAESGVKRIMAYAAPAITKEGQIYNLISEAKKGLPKNIDEAVLAGMDHVVYSWECDKTYEEASARGELVNHVDDEKIIGPISDFTKNGSKCTCCYVVVAEDFAGNISAVVTQNVLFKMN